MNPLLTEIKIRDDMGITKTLTERITTQKGSECRMNVLVACEESQRVCTAFRERGFTAFSADIQEPSGGHPEWHILGDVLKVLNGGKFRTMDGTKHMVDKWDLIIAHPPCTYLSNAGARHLYADGELNQKRYKKGVKGKDFFMKFLNADCKHIAVENPIPSRVYKLPKYNQVIQPYMFGHPFTKKTCFWLVGLPTLYPTNEVKPIATWCPSGSYSHKHDIKHKGVFTTDRAKNRSKTFEGIAQAMAQQWGDYLTGKTDRQLSFFD